MYNGVLESETGGNFHEHKELQVTNNTVRQRNGIWVMRCNAMRLAIWSVKYKGEMAKWRFTDGGFDLGFLPAFREHEKPASNQQHCLSSSDYSLLEGLHFFFLCIKGGGNDAVTN
jgi:hypothetical protein